MRHPFIFTLALTCLLTTSHAWARNPDGTLGLIQTPNNGVPVIITPGQSFDAVMTGEASLALVRGTDSWPLESSWTPLPGDYWRVQCVAPDSLFPGPYALTAEGPHQKDRNERAVYLVEAFPEEYSIVHLTDPHIGATHLARPSEETLAEVVAEANASESAFALITGNLTENGTPEQFVAFINILDTLSMPSFVVPGNHDGPGRSYEHFFGPMPYVVEFGLDGYLAFDTKDFLIADPLGPQNGYLHRYRRRIRAARWSVGFTHRYDVTMGMRTQLILFVDDPLDYLVYGHYHREAGEQDGIPWGNTAHIMTPAAINGHWRLIGVNAQELLALETNTATDIPASDDTGDYGSSETSPENGGPSAQ